MAVFADCGLFVDCGLFADGGAPLAVDPRMMVVTC